MSECSGKNLRSLRQTEAVTVIFTLRETYSTQPSTQAHTAAAWFYNYFVRTVILIIIHIQNIMLYEVPIYSNSRTMNYALLRVQRFLFCLNLHPPLIYPYIP